MARTKIDAKALLYKKPPKSRPGQYRKKTKKNQRRQSFFTGGPCR